MKYVAALCVALVLNAAANLLMKIGMKSVQEAGGVLRDGPIGAVRYVLTSPVLLVGLTCFAVNAFCYMFALQSKTLKISLAYPIMVGGGFALIALVAHVHPALAERLTVRQWAGVIIVLLGIIMIASQTDNAAA